LRPATVVELAAQHGYRDLPTTDVDALQRWFVENADAGDLPRYLSTFAHTVGVMQTTDALTRVARECAEDLAADGVVYAEVRFAPELHTESGAVADEVVEAVQEGFRQGSQAATAPGGHPHRHPAHRDAARGALARDRRCSPSSTATPASSASTSPAPRPASPRAGTWTPSSTCSARTATSRSTPARPSGCRRSGRRCSGATPTGSGHGVRIVDDITSTPTAGPARAPGAYVRDKRIPLEMCPTSNVQTGAAASIAEHPIGLLRRLGFRVTVNTDNRLMSGVSVSSEMAALVDAFDYGWEDLRWLTVNAMKSSFLPFDERLALIEGTIKPGWATLAAGVA
jgi:adenosine deaminase